MTDVNATAQAVAWLLKKSGAPMDKMKVQKLLYLADRECMDQTGFPISNDTYYHMPYGPVLSETLDLMNGKRIESEWGKWIRKGDNDELAPARAGDVNREACDHLSDFEIEILDKIWSKFGDMDGLDLSKYTHTLSEHIHVPLKAGRKPLSHADILVALGYDRESARDQAADITSA